MIPNEAWQLGTSRLGKRVLHYQRLDSTNTCALTHAADSANDGLVVLADEQSAGRGQHGRSWSCPGGSGVLMSVLIFPPAALRRPSILTAWAGIGVCEVIRNLTGLEATLKWPNDVLIQGRKVCGILIEQAHGTVVGIGLNVNQPAEYFAAAGLPQGASLAMFAGQTQSCREVARMLIVQMDTEYEQLCQGNVQGLETRWQSRLGLVAKIVEVETATGTFVGRLRELTFENLTLEMAEGNILAKTPESVRHIVADLPRGGQ